MGRVSDNLKDDDRGCDRVLRRRSSDQRKRLLSSSSTSQSGQQSSPEKKKKRREVAMIDLRVHSAQDSLFSSSSGWTNYRGFINLAMLLLVVSNGRVAIENLIKYGILISPLQWLYFFLHDPWNWPNFGLILLANVTIIIVFFIERALEQGWMSGLMASGLYVPLLGGHLVMPVVVTLRHHSNPIFSAVSLFAYVITFLKLISYAHVNHWCRQARNKALLDDQRRREQDETNGSVTIDESVSGCLAEYPNNLTMKNLYYFILAPTLCYEVKFPRSPRIRKAFLFRRLGEFVILSVVIVALSQQWVMPLLKNSMAPFSEMHLGRCIERLMKLAIPNILIWLLLFYTIFHSLLNIVAELLHFADRQFYRDFWNAEDISYFWRNWNVPVHRWALRHMYRPMVRNGWSKWVALAAVFFVSAFFHEYLVSVPLHMWRLWAYFGMMAQLPLSYLTDHLMNGGRAGNIVVWLSLILGQPLAVLCYVHDWYLMQYDSTWV